MNKKILSSLAIIASGIAMNCYASEVIGPYVGIGGSWDTIDETFDARFSTNTLKSSHDHYDASNSRLAPMIQIGYWAPLRCNYLWGVGTQWNYLGYKTPNDNTSRGQYIPNATFSSINFFGPEVRRDFSSQTRLNNKFLFLAFLGMSARNGYVYLGIGPALLTASNSIYVSSIHTPNGTGDNLTSGSVTAHKTLWGGALQVGYNYYIEPTIFLNMNYSYLASGTHHFKNSVNAAKLNGFDTPGPAKLKLNRSIKFNVQEFGLSINKVFC